MALLENDGGSKLLSFSLADLSALLRTLSTVYGLWQDCMAHFPLLSGAA